MQKSGSHAVAFNQGTGRSGKLFKGKSICCGATHNARTCGFCILLYIVVYYGAHAAEVYPFNHDVRATFRFFPDGEGEYWMADGME